MGHPKVEYPKDNVEVVKRKRINLTPPSSGGFLFEIIPGIYMSSCSLF